MSSALKPALPPGVGQTSPANPPSVPGKSLTAGQNMAQHGGPPAPYATGPLGHIPQSLAGLPHAHSNLGMPTTNSTNMAANMSMNAIPTNMSGMTGHPGMNQASPLNVPNKGAALPPTVAVAGHGRQATHPYLAGGGATPTGTTQPPRDSEGTTLPLPASQNSAQLMAMHRAQQHQPVLHPQQPQQQQQHDQSVSDRFKQQSPQQQQSQSNGTVTGPLEPSTCNNKTITVPATTATQADATKTETPPSAVPTVQNHVPTSSSTTGTHEPNSETKQPPLSPTTPTTAVTIEVISSTTSSNNTTSPPTQPPTPPVVEPKTNVTTPTAAEPEQQQQQPPPAAAAPNAVITPTKAVVVPKEPVKAPTTLKLATTPRTTNRKRETKPSKAPELQKPSTLTKTESRSPVAQNSKPPDKVNKNRTPSEDERKSKRTRTRTQPYQSPIPELALITKLSSVSAASSPSKSQDEKLIVFYKNEFLAVRNAEGGFYVCQAVQNVYKSSPRIRIRWLSQDKQDKIYIPDFYDFTDFDCILTNINMERVEKGRYNLPKDELERTENILKRALAVESGASAPSLTEEHPDGLDLSLFRDESQLKKKRKSATKRKSTIGISLSEDSDDSDYDSKPKRTPDKAKVRRVSRTSSRSSTKRNNQSSDRKSTTPNASNDKKDNTIKTGRRSADGGRAERAKRRGEGSGASLPKTSPVVDHKKARVLAKTMKSTIPAVTQSKKKVGKNAVPVTKATGNATVSVKTSTKTSTRSQGSVASSSSGAASSTAAASSSVSPTRRGKKTKK